MTILLVLLLSLSSYLSVNAFIRQALELASAHDHLTELTALLANIEDAEAADRGFVLTGQDDYLQRYEDDVSHWTVNYDHLATSLSRPSRDHLADLRIAIDHRLARLHQGIALARSDRDQARRFIEESDGEQQMVSIRTGIHNLMQLENQTMARRQAESLSLGMLIKGTDVVAGALALLGAAFASLTIGWLWRRRVLAELAVRESNARLGIEVAERTRELAGANDRLRAQAGDLVRTNQELESFSYSVSHDLRAPLRVIDGLSTIVLNRAGAALSDAARGQLELVVANTKRMRELIDDLLEFSRLGFQELQRQRVEMEQLVADCWSQLANERGERVIAFSAGPLPACYGDPRLLRQVVLNLLSNAVKYTRPREQASIEVQASSSQEQVTYRVSDNGVGFNMASAGRLFGVFQRLHGDAEFEGTGIGLAICRRIIERHGGSIHAESVPDSRTTFSFSLPPAP